MQVSSIETAPGTGSGKENAKPSQAASDAFAILLQNALSQNPAISKLKIPGESAFADLFSADSRTAGEAPRSATRDNDGDAGIDEASAAPTDEGAKSDKTGSQQQTGQDLKDHADREAENLAALTQATEAQISLSRSQTSSAVAAQQDKAASQAAAASKTSLNDGTPAASAAQGIQAPKASANGDLKPEGETGANAGRATAQVIEGGQSFVSRPANTLSAAATLSAQSGNPEKQTPNPTAQAGAANADSAGNAQKSGALANGEAGKNPANARVTENSGNLLLNAGDAKVASGNSGRPGQQTAQYVQTAANGATNSPSAAQQAAVPVQPVPVQPAQSATNGKPAPIAERPGPLPVTESAPTIGAGPTGTTTTASTARVAAPVPARPASPPPDLKEQISVQVQKAVEQGVDRIRIQLKPADLGRLEIQLDVAQDGKVAIIVNADRPETLEMLRRDARGLQQALQDAGLQTGSGDLSFNLGSGNASFGDRLADSRQPENGSDANAVTADENSEATDTNLHRRSSNSTIDLEV